jgi:bacteriocin-like protein
MYFDSEDIRDTYLQHGKAGALPFFLKHYGRKLLKKLNNVDETLDITYIVDSNLKGYIPILKFFDFTPSVYNNIRSFHYSYYKVFDNMDELLVEIRIEKHMVTKLWSIEADFNVFLESLTDKELKNIMGGHTRAYNLKSEDKSKNDFITEMKRLKLNVQAFFTKYNIKK